MIVRSCRFVRFWLITRFGNLTTCGDFNVTTFIFILKFTKPPWKLSTYLEVRKKNLSHQSKTWGKPLPYHSFICHQLHFKDMNDVTCVLTIEPWWYGSCFGAKLSSKFHYEVNISFNWLFIIFKMCGLVE